MWQKEDTSKFIIYDKGHFMYYRKLISLCVILIISFSFGLCEQKNTFYDSYQIILEYYVTNIGEVNYTGIKEERKLLDTFLSNVAAFERKEYEKLTDRGKIAFWINTYNAVAIRMVINHYPLTSLKRISSKHPHNSIKQIPKDILKNEKLMILGNELSLDEIKSELRKKFNDPRVHMALVSATKGDATLRNEVFYADSVDPQLDDQVMIFLSDDLKWKIDKKKNIIYMSLIFKWLASDFLKAHGQQGTLLRHLSKKEKAIIRFVSKYLDGKTNEYLYTNRYEIKYLPYDWALNDLEQKIELLQQLEQAVKGKGEPLNE